jgi:hypothetical protein
MSNDHRRELTCLGNLLGEWRAKHHRPTPIPDDVWSGAAELSKQLASGKWLSGPR